MNASVSIGQRFGNLTVLRKLNRKWNNYDVWECACDCGNVTTPSTYTLLKGKSISCGKRQGHCIDLTGKEFQGVRVLSRQGSGKYGPLWKCQCHCGNLFTAESRWLVQKHLCKSCGCTTDDLTGKRFGSLTVVKRAKNKKYTRSKIWECVCDCGRTVSPTTTMLQKGRSTSCGRCTKNDLTGKRFGKLVAIKRSGRKIGTSLEWVCKCDCGHIVRIKGNSLTSGRTRSCGCLRILYPDRSEPAKKLLYRRYRYGAKKRGVPFSLSLEVFVKLTSSPCYYCGADPQNQVNEGKRSKMLYVYSGIDRVNNAKGYTEENTVPCCIICNMAKSSMPVEKFVEWGLRLEEHLKSLGAGQ